MPQFFATVPRGLEKVLERELLELGIPKPQPTIAGVGFNGNWSACYKANLCLVSASRVLYPVLDFPAYEPDQIYHNVLKHDWTKYISLDQNIAVDSSVRDSRIRDLRIVALKTKDAVVDQFREKFGKRPNVNTENTDLQISVRLVRNQCTVSLDTSGGSLHERGYREPGAPAPMKENLAAALIKMSGWDLRTPFIDPMCGSGTLVVEAALMALRISPGTFRRKFGFQKWRTFQPESFAKVSAEVTSEQLEKLPFRVYGSDSDGKAVNWTRMNSGNAGTSDVTLIKHSDIKNINAPEGPPGTLVTNPPYGERLGEPQDLLPVYKTLGEVLKTRFAQWNCWVLSSDNTLLEATGLEVIESHRVFNGALECRFVKFKTN